MEQAEAETVEAGLGWAGRKHSRESLTGRAWGSRAGTQVTVRFEGALLFPEEPQDTRPGLCYLPPGWLASAAPPCTGLA